MFDPYGVTHHVLLTFVTQLLRDPVLLLLYWLLEYTHIVLWRNSEDMNHLLIF